MFGDESYTLSTRVTDHDVPLRTILGRGNESDFTLGPTSLDGLLTMTRARDLPLGVDIFVGDGQHDALPIYRYLAATGITPVIPLAGTESDLATTAANATHPTLEQRPDVTLDPEDTLLCPGGCRMCHAAYHPVKDSHDYACPHTRPQRDGSYRFVAEACPKGQPCRPDKRMGYGMSLAGRENPRVEGPIPRDSARVAALYAERTGVERSNAVEDAYHLDHCSRHTVSGLIRLTFVNVAKHARLRWLDQRAHASANALLRATLDRLTAAPESRRRRRNKRASAHSILPMTG